MSIKKFVSLFPHVARKQMPAIGMFDAEVLRRPIQPVNRRRCPRNLVHAAPSEIRVAERRVDKNLSWRQRTDEFVEVERNFIQSSGILREPGHVTRLAPAAFRLPDRRIAAVVIDKRIEAAADRKSTRLNSSQ